MKILLTIVFIGGCLMLGACSPVGMAGAAGVGVGAAAVREGGITGTLEDTRIHAEVADKLFKYDLGTFSKVSITVDQARVLLSGVVQNPENRVEAVRGAWQVRGVKQVINEIKVANGEGVSGFLRDTWISTRLRTMLTFDDIVQNLNYSIDTVQGTVYLMGVAQNQRELDRVLQLARTISGVRGVVSYVKVLDGAGPEESSSVSSSSLSSPSPASVTGSGGGAGSWNTAPASATSTSVPITPSVRPEAVTREPLH